MDRLAPRLRSRADWQSAWEALANEHTAAAEDAQRADDPARAREEIRRAFMAWAIALGGDGYYFTSSAAVRQAGLHRMQRLFNLWRRVTQARTERLLIEHAQGRSFGRLHLPPGADSLPPRSLPALLAFHPLGDSKDTFDYVLSPFRDVGYATFCVDLPGHGESFSGPRLRPDSEDVGLAALDVLAAHPAIDPQRLGVLGGSLGGYFALRTAARSSRVKVCVGFATPFDLEEVGPTAAPGVVETFAHMVGAANEQDIVRLGCEFHLNGYLQHIRCPVCLVHGTQDSICDFSMTYAIVSQVTQAPVEVFPLEGVDHEAAYPLAPHLVQPALEWLKEHL